MAYQKLESICERQRGGIPFGIRKCPKPKPGKITGDQTGEAKHGERQEHTSGERKPPYGKILRENISFFQSTPKKKKSAEQNEKEPLLLHQKRKPIKESTDEQKMIRFSLLRRQQQKRRRHRK